MTEIPDRQKPDGKAISGGLWTVVERVTAQLGQLVVFIAAARILGPADFGFFALVSAYAVLLLRVAEAGWAQFIMSWSGTSKVPQQVLLIAILSGLVMALAGGLSGVMLPLFGFSQLAAHLVILFSLWVFLATTSSAQKGIMIWQDKLKSSAASEILGELAGFIVALVALFSGFGVLSLVFGRLAFQSVHLIVSFLVTRMRPRSGLRGKELRRVLGFSSQIFLARLGINLRLYAATFIIGGFLGPASVGFYRAAERLVGALAEVVSVPTEVLAWSLFRQTRDAQNGRLDGFHRRATLFFRALFALSIPVFIWLAVMSDELITSLLGREWLPALPIVAILALSRAIMMPGMATEAILSLAGQVRRLIPFTMIYLVLGVAATLVGVQFGLAAVAWSQVVVAIAVFAATIWIQGRYGAINWLVVAWKCARLVGPVLISAGTLVLLHNATIAANLSPIMRVALPSIAALIVYGAVLALTEPELRRVLRGRSRAKIGSTPV